MTIEGPRAVVLPDRATFAPGPDWAAMLRVSPRALLGYLMRTGWGATDAPTGRPLDADAREHLLSRLPARFATGADAHLMVHLVAWVEGRDVADVWRAILGSAGHA